MWHVKIEVRILEQADIKFTPARLVYRWLQSMFNPFTASFDEAQALNGEDYSPSSPISQWVSAQYINESRKRIEDGDGFEVLACIRRCVTSGLIAPKWLGMEFNKRYDSVLNCRAKSWDDNVAFGIPYKKGTNIAALKKKRKFMFAVYIEIQNTLESNPCTPIDAGLFETVGKKFNLGKTLTSEYYYEAKKYAIAP